ncbi:MAG TPA: hypothetical protein ENK18_12660 [Deltaproteobacteria bacterium]|nr:hypothetical protein [Deltaproteobacteria bacterium]
MVSVTAGLACLVGLGGCEPAPPTLAMTLKLLPDFVNSGAVLDEDPEIKLVRLLPDGEEIISYVGTGARGTELTLSIELPVPGGTQIGLLAERSGSISDEWQPSQTLAYGQGVVAEDLITGDHELAFLVANVGQLAEFSLLAEARRRWRGAAVMLPNGDTYLFGGGDPQSANIHSSRVLKLTRLDQGNTSFQNVGEIPTFNDRDGNPVPERVGMGAALVEVDGAPAILITGGRDIYDATFPDVDGWFLWDPATDTVLDQADPLDPEDSMGEARSEHLSIPFEGGNVLLYGGIVEGGISTFASYTIWKSRSGRFERGTEINDVEAGRMHAMGAPSGGEVVVCGGLIISFGLGDQITWTPTNACNRFQPDGSVEPFPPLPGPLAGGTMLALEDGSLLVTGGFSEPIEEIWDQIDPFGSLYTSSDAVRDAFLYDVTTNLWREVGPLALARAHHRMVPLSDGRVVVIGGSTMGNALFGAYQEAVRCTELFDPDTETFAQAGCSDVGRGAHPLVAWYPGEDAVVIEGAWGEQDISEGGSEYGLIGLGPALTR